MTSRPLIGLAVLALLLQGLACKDPPIVVKGQRMRVELQQFSFEIPPGFDDWTNYSFKNREDDRVLTVSTGSRPPEASNLEALMSNRKSQLEQVIPGAVTLQAERDGSIGPWPARLLTFEVADRKRRFREHWAVAFDSPKTYIQISYGSPAENSESAEQFAHILRSVASPGSPGRTGFVRRWAGIFSLDVPAELFPPRTYQFTTSDEATHLALSAYTPSDSSRHEPSLEQEASEDERRGTVSGKVAAEFTSEKGGGQSLTYVLESETPDGNILEVRRRVLLRLGEGARVHLYGRARADAAARLEQIMASWISSFAPAK